MKKITLTLVIIVSLIVSSLLLTRLSDDVLKNIVANQIQTSLREEKGLEDILLLELLTPYAESVIENELVINDNILFKNVQINGMLNAKYLSIFGSVLMVEKPTFNLSILKEYFGTQEPTGITDYAYIYNMDEIYTNIQLSENSTDYGILKIQIEIIYSKEGLDEIIEKKEDEIIDYICGYFRDVNVEEINNTGGKDGIKFALVDAISDIINDSVDNVLFTQFIIQ